MIVRNEEQHLPRCLKSVQGLVDEIVVVDTGSTDGTVAIAREFGARVIDAAWENDFSKARNVGLAEARGRWILVLDADEFLAQNGAAALRKFVESPSSARADRAYNLIVRSTTDGGNTGHPAYIVRLFPNRSDVRYEWPVHEQVVTSLVRAHIAVENAPIVILHTGYADPTTIRRKQRRNGELLRRQIDEGARVTPMTHYLYAGCLLDLGENEQALDRYRTTRDLARNDPPVRRAATVRMVTCLLALGRSEEALALIPERHDSGWHPEMVMDRAKIALARDGPDSARTYFERVLDCSDVPEIPTCNVGLLKIEALKFLGNYWHERGQKEWALRLLRAAVAIKKEGRDFTAVDLRAACQ